MENIILSLLLLKSMTIYKMRVFIQQNLSTVCSDSFGSLQSAIKKLLNKNHIVLREYHENGVAKKQYSITEDGIIQFKDWIGTPMNLQKIKNMEEGKFFFLGMAPRETRISSIQGYIELFIGMSEHFLNKESTYSDIDRGIGFGGCIVTIKNRKTFFIDCRKNNICKVICP